MNFDPNIHAELVWDGGDVHVPERLGKPAANQLLGTPLEQLAELAGRICYDSLGKGRSSAEYHKHIAEVKHLSVYEHCVFSVVQPFGAEGVADVLHYLNRPGVRLEVLPDRMHVTMNLRALLEFWGHDHEQIIDRRTAHRMEDVISALWRAVHPLAPQIVPLDVRFPPESHPHIKVVEPPDARDQWITLLLCGSRGLSHELVRHGDSTAMSQRSTRYVDESASPWVEHPLITRFKTQSPPVDQSIGMVEWVPGKPSLLQFWAAKAYDATIAALEPWAVSRGVDKLTARKQARGAGRGFLGNALYTELIFSASVMQWRHMLKMRCSDHADAEIRVLFARALPELKRSRYGDSFKDMELRPATDGIGEVLA